MGPGQRRHIRIPGTGSGTTPVTSRVRVYNITNGGNATTLTLKNGDNSGDVIFEMPVGISLAAGASIDFPEGLLFKDGIYVNQIGGSGEVSLII